MGVDSKTFALQGGLDLTTTGSRMTWGHCINGLNHEPVELGYARVDGFERLDGRPRPSDASYWVLNFDAGTATIAAGATVTGQTSGATGIAAQAMTVSSGTFGASSAAGYLVLYQVSGTFQDNENLRVAGVTKCVANGLAVERGALTDANDLAWRILAIEATRTAILTVPGEGNILGAWAFNNVRYAFRNNVGSTAAKMFKSTTAGWVEVNLGRQILFSSGGTVEIAEGDTITGATSAATAVARRIILTSGSWADGDAAGRIILSGQVGTFVAENLNVGASLNVATVSADSAAIALPANGRYEFRNHNFYGASNLRRMYGVNGVGPAFEFDGNYFVPILTGMTDDRPTHLAIHKEQLLLAFRGGSVQTSAVGEPYDWTVVLGASEIMLGADITGFCEDLAGSLTILGTNRVKILYGNDREDFVLQPISEDSGGIEWTIQKVVRQMYLDKGGLRDIRTTQTFGNFRLAALTSLVKPLLDKKAKAGVTPVASVRCRTKGQYRLFWSDGSGITVFLGRRDPEILPFNLGLVVSTICSSEDNDGREVMLFGSTTGYVYELDAGTSFDGTAVDAYLRLAFCHVGSPDYNKAWKSAILDIQASPTANISIIAEFDSGNMDQPPGVMADFTITGAGGFYDVDDWDEFYWSAPVDGKAYADLDGFGANCSIAIASQNAYEPPYTVHGLTLGYSMRGRVRING